MVREISGLLQASIPPRVQVRLELQDNLPAVLADASQLQQVVMNLVINGVEAIGGEQGMVVVTSGVQDVDQQYAAAISAQGEIPARQVLVYLEVNDSGCGMDEETLERIFDPFHHQVRGPRTGLAAVLGIVHGHKGALKVYSAPGKGSTFKVFFPVMHQSLPLRRPRPAGELWGNAAVLVIDDEEIVRKAASHTLERYGYTVFTAADGRSGLQVFQENLQIALVLLDLTMPGWTAKRCCGSCRPSRRAYACCSRADSTKWRRCAASPGRNWPASSRSPTPRGRWRAR